MRVPTTLVFLVLSALLAGCATPRSLVPGQSTEADVRARLGAPTDSLREGNGDQLWDYATGPLGYYTYRVRIGADGKVKEVTQLLTDEQLMKVVPGTMTKADVRRLLGRPAKEETYRAGTVWSWRFMRDGIQPGYLTVTFNSDGTVKERVAIIDPSDDRERTK